MDTHDDYGPDPEFEQRMAALMQRVADDIKRVGWFCTGVFDHEGDKPTFAYTVGLWEQFNHPELFIAGLDINNAHQILANIVARIKQAHFAADGGGELHSPEPLRAGDELTEIVKGFPLRLTETSNELMEAYFAISDRYYERPVPRLQVVWPDRQGHFPGENCDPAIERAQDLSRTLQ